MLKIITFIILLTTIAAGAAWHSAQSLPGWFSDAASQESQTTEELNTQIRQQGATRFLDNKAAKSSDGNVVLNNTEFNAVLLASLESHDEGQILIAISDAIKAFIKKDQLEISAIVNLDKVEKINPKARESVEKFDRFFPFLNGSRVAITVYGTPVARNGNIAIKDDFHIKVGAIPISNNTLRQLGVDVERANNTDLPLGNRSINNITLRDGEIEFSISPDK